MTSQPSDHDYIADYMARCRKAWPKDLPKEPFYPFGEVPIGEYLRNWSRLQPEATAISYYGRRISYQELNDLSDRFAQVLVSHGVCTGDRIAVFLGNCPQFHIAFFAIMKLGAVHVPANPRYTAGELLYQLSDTQAKIIITHDSLYPLVEEVKARSALQVVFVTGIGAMLPETPEGPLAAGLTAKPIPCPNALELMASIGSVKEKLELKVQPSLDTPAAINYTGGTTGLPKGCIHTQRDMLYTAACAVAQVLEMNPSSVSLVFFPIFWTSGQNAGVFIPIFSGSSVVLLARWDPMAVMLAIDRHGVTHTKMLVDNVVELLAHARRGEFGLRSLRKVHTVSFVKKLNERIRREWQDWTGSCVSESGWGMTETQSHDTFTTRMDRDDFDLRLGQGFVGLPVPGTYFKIIDPVTGCSVPYGMEGEICVRTPSIFKGYWNDTGMTTAPASQDGWFRSGDTGFISEEGYLWYLGRRREMLKVRGMSVFPGEIEAVLGEHPQVSLCAVVGKPDPVAGDLPVAFVCARNSARLSVEALLIWCRERLANYKVPEVRIVESMAMTPTGKIKKEELRKLLAPSAQ